MAPPDVAPAPITVNFVDEQNGVVMVFQLGDHRFQAFFKIAAIAGAGQQGAHVQGIDRGIAQHLGHFAQDHPAGQALGNGSLADAGVAHQQGVVLLPPAEDLDGPLQLLFPPDHRVDTAAARLVVQINAIGGQGLVAGFDRAFFLFLFLRPAHRAFRVHARRLGDAVRDVADRIQARHVLFLQEVNRVTFTLRKDRDQDIGPGNLIPAR